MCKMQRAPAPGNQPPHFPIGQAETSAHKVLTNSKSEQRKHFLGWQRTVADATAGAGFCLAWGQRSRWHRPGGLPRTVERLPQFWTRVKTGGQNWDLEAQTQLLLHSTGIWPRKCRGKKKGSLNLLSLSSEGSHSTRCTSVMKSSNLCMRFLSRKDH